MNSRRSRKAAVTGFGTVAVALILSSAAYGCTIFRGQARVNNAEGTSEQTYVGKQVGMNLCSSTGAVQTNAAPGQATTVWKVTPADTCLNADGVNKLRAGTYNVQYSPSGQHNCHFPGVGERIGLMTIDAKGRGSGTYSFTGLPGAGTVCVFDQGSPDAIEATVNLV